MRMTIRRGTIGGDTRYLQQALYSLGYDNLIVDGIFGAKTELAVKDFQGKMGLKVDGVVGPKTWDAVCDNLQRAGRYDLLEPEEREEAQMQVQSAGTAPQEPDDGEITLPDEPIWLWYPAGQRMVFSRDAAIELSQRIQERLVYSGDEVEFIAPVGMRLKATAVAAVNIWQQIRDAGKVVG